MTPTLSDLELALNSATPATRLPPVLPIAHLTIARWLTPILKARSLQPRRCTVFNEDLLYFSYGGVFYRTGKFPTENTTELPIAMVFEPAVLSQCDRLFPFDSGAMMKRVFGDGWYDKMSPVEKRFAVTTPGPSNAARVLVGLLYGDNGRYLDGRPIKHFDEPESEMKLLHAFLNEDLSGVSEAYGGVDHRQRSIEILSKEGLSIAKHLLWIGMPVHRLTRARRLLGSQTPSTPQFHTYTYARNHNPDGIAERLQYAAYEAVIKDYQR